MRTDEWILAIIRLLLGVCYLTTFFRPDSTPALPLHKFLLASYLAYALCIPLILLWRSRLSPFAHAAIHFTDILWVTQLTLLIQWPIMGLALFCFVIASSTLRWGFWEALLTLVSYFALIAAGFYLHNPQLVLHWISQNGSVLIPEALLYFCLAFMGGLLAESKAVRSESASMARITELLRSESGLEAAVGSVSSEGCQVYAATQVVVVIHERSRNRSMMFRAVGSQPGIQACELDAAQQQNYQFPKPGTSVRMAIRRHSMPRRFRCHLFSEDRLRRSKVCGEFPGGFLAAHPFHRMLASALEIKDDYAVHVYVIDPAAFSGGCAGLRSLHYSMRKINPVIYDLFLVGRLKYKAQAIAGARIARELHDGAIQSLSCINMQLEELRMQTGAIFAQDTDPFARIQESIRDQIASLRDLTQQLRSQGIDSGSLLQFLAGMATKFECEYGIATQFIPETDEVQLPPKICMEVVRIVQESLVNIRKHSHAKEAHVIFSRQNGNFLLRIIDNGRGFGFSGSRTQEELRATGSGPVVLMERVQSIGGSICIESEEGAGTCLEIVFPARKPLVEDYAGFSVN